MNKLKVLMTRSHLEAHDRGIKYTSRKLVEAGVEVVYAPFREIDDIYKTAVEEDVGMIGISCSATSSVYIISVLMKLLEENKMDLPVIVGGVIPSVDVIKLRKMRVKEVFGPGSDPNAIVEYVKEALS